MLWNAVAVLACVTAGVAVFAAGFIRGMMVQRRWIAREAEKLEALAVALVAPVSRIERAELIDLLRDPTVETEELFDRIFPAAKTH